MLSKHSHLSQHISQNPFVCGDSVFTRVSLDASTNLVNVEFTSPPPASQPPLKQYAFKIAFGDTAKVLTKLENWGSNAIPHFDLSYETADDDEAAAPMTQTCSADFLKKGRPASADPSTILLPAIDLECAAATTGIDAGVTWSTEVYQSAGNSVIADTRCGNNAPIVWRLKIPLARFLEIKHDLGATEVGSASAEGEVIEVPFEIIETATSNDGMVSSRSIQQRMKIVLTDRVFISAKSYDDALTSDVRFLLAESKVVRQSWYAENFQLSVQLHAYILGSNDMISDIELGDLPDARLTIKSQNDAGGVVANTPEGVMFASSSNDPNSSVCSIKKKTDTSSAAISHTEVPLLNPVPGVYYKNTFDVLCDFSLGTAKGGALTSKDAVDIHAVIDFPYTVYAATATENERYLVSDPLRTHTISQSLRLQSNALEQFDTRVPLISQLYWMHPRSVDKTRYISLADWTPDTLRTAVLPAVLSPVYNSDPTEIDSVPANMGLDGPLQHLTHIDRGSMLAMYTTMQNAADRAMYKLESLLTLLMVVKKITSFAGNPSVSQWTELSPNKETSTNLCSLEQLESSKQLKSYSILQMNSNRLGSELEDANIASQLQTGTEVQAPDIFRVNGGLANSDVVHTTHGANFPDRATNAIVTPLMAEFNLDLNAIESAPADYSFTICQVVVADLRDPFSDALQPHSATRRMLLQSITTPSAQTADGVVQQTGANFEIRPAGFQMFDPPPPSDVHNGGDGLKIGDISTNGLLSFSSEGNSQVTESLVMAVTILSATLAVCVLIIGILLSCRRRQSASRLSRSDEPLK
ncbi:hypothetical protein CYMTET_14295 [Cymbomonas tetramitiformis]|uniref:Uncharacterized protein n=1 Tax=Cymbomonas tetramitiformis TaxID=36881 RepID=A0AAE0LAB4_9CHLO|nr:hypothetical protein CYMTET_14295 [Cymbomonas tetramitiformis]